MNIRSIFAFVGLASMPAVTFAATPTITSVGGTVQSGQTLTISGSNMNNEAKTGWDNFFVSHPNAWSFEGATPNEDGYGLIGGGGVRGVYDTNVKVLGNKSIRFHIQGAATSNLGDYTAFSVQSIPNEWWIRGYVSWSLNGGTWPSSHIKMLFPWMASFGGGGLAYQPDFSTSGAPPSNMNVTYPEVFGGGHVMHRAPIPSGQIENKRWYAIELRYRSSPALVEAYMDNQLIYQATNIPSTKTPGSAILFGVVNACCTITGFSLDHWWDGLAYGNTRIYPSAVVEIGNSSNYATATKKYQQPLLISDGSVQIKANLTGLGSGPYYLWVTNNRRELSQAYALSAGGGSTPLSAPQNLKVQ